MLLTRLFPYRSQINPLSKNKIESVHKEESEREAIVEEIGGYVKENEYPELHVVYKVQDRYRALYDLILNPVVDHDDPEGGSSAHLLSKIAKFRASCLCGTKDSGSYGRMENACPSGMRL